METQEILVRKDGHGDHYLTETHYEKEVSEHETSSLLVIGQRLKRAGALTSEEKELAIEIGIELLNRSPKGYLEYGEQKMGIGISPTRGGITFARVMCPTSLIGCGVCNSTAKPQRKGFWPPC